ncbi:sulfurtransferase TusA family protein [Marinomonas mediterranea]|jgi:Predicted redox protein, regulator of disulfide bond formation|uniref:SirA-like domain-containing protein n=1 Tax=Marinomonas mediterranea (strain ATCC 700492 / JCM 21426 / NBRC 103028 / MMB-1) TaxID=717774 RepID=F2K2U5_MARM1|nr:sulfurtransferase TusA family protein [Marinomonas mediterranea]ADZ91228.1 SirA-like domain-containing protein [Marinomonas mediterranea MMB-1]WCN09203.1 sulfurtransferase TusA family protein [Marinomonas mediterranea]WCN13286.1 sulfurtransferase TusA family protein [Marinomonas mediterranea]WCN17354.1 sulfurtransferase TusA family protein [Marinomonas mediterranea MMB-1]
MLPIDKTEYDVFVDALEDRCPMPLLKTKMALAKMDVEGRLCVLASDEGSMKDIPKYIEISEYILEDSKTIDGIFMFVIKKGSV